MKVLRVLLPIAAMYATPTYAGWWRREPILMEGCGSYSGEFVFIQDVSTSVFGDLTVLGLRAPQLFDDLQEVFPGFKFGVATFSDKVGEAYLGEPGDVCYKLELALTSKTEPAFEAIDNLRIENGGDPSESQLDALFHSVASDHVGWSPNEFDASGRQIMRVVILVTDNVMHSAGDGRVDIGLTRHDGRKEAACQELDYPTRKQVGDAMRIRGVQPLFLVTEDYLGYYFQVLQDIGVGGSVQKLDSDSFNIAEAIKFGLSDIACADELPTPAPTEKPTEPGSGGGGGGDSTTTTGVPPIVPPPASEGVSTGVVIGAAAAGVAAVGAAAAGGVAFMNRVGGSVPAPEVQIVEEGAAEAELVNRESMARVAEADFV